MSPCKSSPVRIFGPEVSRTIKDTAMSNRWLADCAHWRNRRSDYATIWINEYITEKHKGYLISILMNMRKNLMKWTLRLHGQNSWLACCGLNMKNLPKQKSSFNSFFSAIRRGIYLPRDPHYRFSRLSRDAYDERVGVHRLDHGHVFADQVLQIKYRRVYRAALSVFNTSGVSMTTPPGCQRLHEADWNHQPV